MALKNGQMKRSLNAPVPILLGFCIQITPASISPLHHLREPHRDRVFVVGEGKQIDVFVLTLPEFMLTKKDRKGNKGMV